MGVVFARGRPSGAVVTYDSCGSDAATRLLPEHTIERLAGLGLPGMRVPVSPLGGPVTE